MPELSIVISFYGEEKLLINCLNSLFQQDIRHIEIIIVDNNSNLNFNLIKKEYPGVSLIINEKNLGAAKAKNQGIELAVSEWILCLDCDIVLEKHFISQSAIMIKDINSNIGIIQPKILNWDRKTIYSGGIYLSRMRRFFDIGKGQPDNNEFNDMKFIFGACSAAAFYKRSMLEEIKEKTGYFDERFFFLVEDVDLAWRAQIRGWKAVYYPEAICYHLGNSSNTDRKTRQFLCFRNRHLLIFKNERRSVTIIKMPFYLIYDLPKFLMILFRHKFHLNPRKSRISSKCI